LFLEDVVIVSNTADFGGGVFVGAGGLIADRVTLGNNSAQADGGGIYTEGGVLDLGTDSAVQFNDAVHQGGGIALRNGASVACGKGTGILLNTADSGAGLVADPGMTLNGCHVDLNEATTSGGGLSLSGAGNTLIDSIVYGNTAGADGGGIHLDALGSLSLIDSSATGNDAAQRGGGVYLGPDGSLTGSGAAELIGNTATDGGGLYLDDATATGVSVLVNSATTGGGAYTRGIATLDQSTLSGNTADDGGGLYVQGSLAADALENNANMATAKGGGLFADFATITFGYPANLALNDAVDGGGAYLVGSVLVGGSLTSNTATRGAGIYVAPEPTYHSALAGTIVQLNTSSAEGGGAYVESAVLDVTLSSEISLNISYGNGAGFFADGSTLNVTDTEMLANGNTLDGGAFCLVNGSELIANRATLRINFADQGGGFFLDGGSTATVADSSVITSLATLGGGAHLIDGTLDVTASDWGMLLGENLPDDVWIAPLSQSYTAYAAGSTFFCDPSGCL